MRILLAALMLLLATAASAMTTTFTAPTATWSLPGCPPQGVLGKLNPNVLIVCYLRLETTLTPPTPLWTDSVATLPGTFITRVHANPDPGTYTLRAWSRAGGQVSCDTTVTFQYAPLPTPKPPSTIGQKP